MKILSMLMFVIGFGLIYMITYDFHRPIFNLEIFSLIGWSMSFLTLIFAVSYKFDLSKINDFLLAKQIQFKHAINETSLILQRKTEEIRSLKNEKAFLMATLEKYTTGKNNDNKN